MKKRLFYSLVLALSLLLSACGRSAEPTAVPSAAPAPSETASPATEPPRGSIRHFVTATQIELDGTETMLTLGTRRDEYDTITALVIILGDESFEHECYGYSVEPYLITTAEGGHFLYAQLVTDNDYRLIEVFSIDANTVTYLHTIGAGLVGELTDPAALMLEKRIALLGTNFGTRLYSVDSFGEPQPIEPYFTLHSSYPLTLHTEMAAELVNEAGEVVDVQTLPVGTMLSLVRTDGEHIVDLRLESGELCRVYVESEWPQTVNGLDAQSVFEGMIFAG